MTDSLLSLPDPSVWELGSRDSTFMNELMPDRNRGLGFVPETETNDAQRKLVHVVLEAVSSCCSGNSDTTAPSEFGGKSLHEMLLSLLTYSYASATYGSQEIESRLARDARIRKLCARTDLTWHTLRKFRRQNRNVLKAALAHVLESMPELISNTEMATCVGARRAVDYADRTTFPDAFPILCVAVAERRIERAVIADTAALDD
ncbi:MAG: hypothetical protein K9N62_03260 [Verrucomicrobia bacterium]|jgi:hypothetical protein|nr:hypothetical protein [Verrucomicrobiota bacterium]